MMKPDFTDRDIRFLAVSLLAMSPAKSKAALAMMPPELSTRITATLTQLLERFDIATAQRALTVGALRNLRRQVLKDQDRLSAEREALSQRLESALSSSALGQQACDTLRDAILGDFDRNEVAA